MTPIASMKIILRVAALLAITLVVVFWMRFNSAQNTSFSFDYPRWETLAKSHPQGERIMTSIRNYETTINDEDPANDSEAYLGIGFELRQLGEEKSAIKAHIVGLALNDHNMRGWANLAVLYKETGKYKEAEEAYKKVIALNPGDVTTYRDLSDLYLYYLTKKEGEIPAVIAQGLASVPEHPDLLVYLAVYYRDKGNVEKAIEYFERRAKVAPLDPDIAKGIAEELNKLYSQR